jgi:hypothetical protein
MDIDILVGFWIGEMPYIWISNENYKECKRFYLFNPEGDFSLFGENNEVTNREYILNKRIKINNDETFCLLPLGIDEPKFKRSPISHILKEIPEYRCEQFIRNYFLCDILLNKLPVSLSKINKKYGKKAELRSKGKKILPENLYEYDTYFKQLTFNKFYIENDYYNYKKEYYIYPVQYTKNFDKNASSVIFATYVPLVYYRDSEKMREYNNFFELPWDMTKNQKKEIHFEAMSYLYDKLNEGHQKIKKENVTEKKRLKGDLQLLENFLSKIGENNKYIEKKPEGWRYELKDYTTKDKYGIALNGNILLAQFNYENSVKIRKSYIVRPSGNYFIQPRKKIIKSPIKKRILHPEDIDFDTYFQK